MNKVFFILCLAFGLAKSLNLSDMRSVDDTVATLCGTIEARPTQAAAFIDRMQKMLNERQQQIQERFPRTFVYITKQENKDKLKAGGPNCKTFFDGLKAPLSTDLQNNKDALQYIQQITGERFKDFINEIAQQSG